MQAKQTVDNITSFNFHLRNMEFKILYLYRFTNSSNISTRLVRGVEKEFLILLEYFWCLLEAKLLFFRFINIFQGWIKVFQLVKI